MGHETTSDSVQQMHEYNNSDVACSILVLPSCFLAHCRMSSWLLVVSGVADSPGVRLIVAMSSPYIPEELIEFVEGLSAETFKNFPTTPDNTFKLTPSQVSHIIES